MKKLLKPQDILLLGASEILDVFEEIRDPFGLLSKGYESMYGFVPRKYKRSNFAHLVWRNLKTGYIEKVIKNGNVYIRLTSQGEKKVKRDFPMLSLQRMQWDKKWRLVIFDIEEISRSLRDGMRRKLKELGFGMFQKSVYISPHNITEDFKEFIESKSVSDVVYIFETSTVISSNVKSLANKIWGLDKINQKYDELVTRINTNYLTIFNDRVKQLNKRLEPREQNNLKELLEEYIYILRKDPFLPKEMLPDDWKGKHASSLIKEIISKSKMRYI